MRLRVILLVLSLLAFFRQLLRVMNTTRLPKQPLSRKRVKPTGARQQRTHGRFSGVSHGRGALLKPHPDVSRKRQNPFCHSGKGCVRTVCVLQKKWPRNSQRRRSRNPKSLTQAPSRNALKTVFSNLLAPLRLCVI